MRLRLFIDSQKRRFIHFKEPGFRTHADCISHSLWKKILEAPKIRQSGAWNQSPHRLPGDSGTDRSRETVPGTWIVKGDLAKHLGMSRTPVRGALHWLQREGYVHEHKNVSKSRMFVAPLIKDDASELYSIIARVIDIFGERGSW